LALHPEDNLQDSGASLLAERVAFPGGFMAKPLKEDYPDLVIAPS